MTSNARGTAIGVFLLLSAVLSGTAFSLESGTETATAKQKAWDGFLASLTRAEKEAFLRLPAPLREKIRTADPGEPEKLTTEDRLRLNGLEPSLRRKITTLLLQKVKEKEEQKPRSPLEGAA